jgi:hypothetical protein
MTERSSDERIDAAPGPITGHAEGSLGTGTALDDTQEYEVADWLGVQNVTSPQPSEPASQPLATPSPRSAGFDPGTLPARGVAPTSTTTPAAARPAAIAGTSGPYAGTRVASRRNLRRSTSGSGTAGPRTAAILAAVLLVLVAAFALTNGFTPRDDGGIAQPGANAGATEAPTEAPDDDDDDDDEGGNDGEGGRGGGNGGGNGNGNGGNGNGRGNGNGNGNGGGGGDD